MLVRVDWVTEVFEEKNISIFRVKKTKKLDHILVRHPKVGAKIFSETSFANYQLIPRGVPDFSIHQQGDENANHSSLSVR
jgi:hypothetical protein